MKKSLLFVSSGIAITALATFLLRMTKIAWFMDDLTMFIILLVLALIFMVWGLIAKR